MMWEVKGADRKTGKDRKLTIEADTEDSARRRGARAGLMVESVRSLDAGDSSAGLVADRATESSTSAQVAAPPHPSKRQARNSIFKTGCGCLIMIVLALVLFGIVGTVINLVHSKPKTADEMAAQEAAEKQQARADAADAAKKQADQKAAEQRQADTERAQAAKETEDRKAADVAAAEQSKKIEAARLHAEAVRADAEAKLRRDAPVFSVQELINTYAGNEVAADENLKGKYFKVQGTVDRIGKDILGTPYVLFAGPAGTFRAVQCSFKDSSKLATIQPGQPVVIFGKGAGMMGNVLMNDCEFVN